jgi:hypothetical protein
METARISAQMESAFSVSEWMQLFEARHRLKATLATREHQSEHIPHHPPSKIEKTYD